MSNQHNQVDSELTDYLLGQLSAEEESSLVEHLQQNPRLQNQVLHCRRILAPLQISRETPITPPAGLVSRTIAALTSHLVSQHSEISQARPTIHYSVDGPVFMTRSRADWVIAFSILMMVSLLLIPGIQKLRQQNQLASCQQNLHLLHGALVSYAESKEGKLPQVGTSSVPTAGDFVHELGRHGEYLGDWTVSCSPNTNFSSTQYAYTLGHLEHGRVVGARWPDADREGMPIVADRATQASSTPPPHGSGWNVLYLGGHVRYTTTVAAGLNRDDIFLNENGLPKAGLHAWDTVLGCGTDRP